MLGDGEELMPGLQRHMAAGELHQRSINIRHLYSIQDAKLNLYNLYGGKKILLV